MKTVSTRMMMLAAAACLAVVVMLPLMQHRLARGSDDGATAALRLVMIAGEAYGACCLPDGGCDDVDVAEADCDAVGGMFQGVGSNCAVLGAVCPQPGACCLSGGDCIQATEVDDADAGCGDSGGEYQGNNTFCGDNFGEVPVFCEDPEAGACCLEMEEPTLGDVCEQLNQDQCQSQGGVYQGDNTACSGGTCSFDVTNDTCDSAIALMVPGATTGTTINSTDDPELWDCFKPDNEVPAGGGIWYSIIGTGEFLHASACPGFDGHIAVFCGPCDTPTCVDTAPDGNCSGFEQLGGGGSDPGGVGWCSAEGVLYYILVHATTADGMFELSITADGEPCEDGAICDVPLPNDDCDDAIEVAVPSQTAGTLAGAQDDFESELCFDELPEQESNLSGIPGVWYSVTGTGTVLNASVCETQEYQLSVFCGPCDNLTCIGNSTLPDLTASTVGCTNFAVSWCAAEGVTYYILVQRDLLGGSLLGGDTFTLSITDTEKPCEPDVDCGPAQAQDECEDAEPVCPGTQYFDDTFDATPSSLIPGFTLDCGAAFGLVDVWYEYTPRWTGDAFFSISGVNNSHTQWVLAVYTDCAGHEDDMILCLGGGIIAPAPVIRGETYYIRIARLINDVGEFRFQLFGPECLNLEGDFNDDGIVDDEQCLSDVNGDNTVNAEDFLDILFNFGDCPNNAPCPRDVTFDGIIDQQDLAQVFEDFGECLLNPLGDDDRPKEFDALDVRGR